MCVSWLLGGSAVDRYNPVTTPRLKTFLSKRCECETAMVDLTRIVGNIFMYPTAFGNRTTTGGCGTPLHLQYTSYPDLRCATIPTNRRTHLAKKLTFFKMTVTSSRFVRFLIFFDLQKDGSRLQKTCLSDPCYNGYFRLLQSCLRVAFSSAICMAQLNPVASNETFRPAGHTYFVLGTLACLFGECFD